MFEHLPYFVSMLFTMALIVYSLFLMYTLYLEKKTTLSWIFILICLAMAVWSMSYAVSASAETIFIARRWQRVAVWGNGTVYSLFLHFTIILTKNDRVFKHKIIYGLIYSPSLLNLLFYSIKTPWVTYEYNLIQSQMGWVTHSSEFLLDWYFYGYFLIFFTLTLVMLIRWRLKTKDKKEIKQFRLIFYAFLVAVVIGTISDIILVNFFELISPQIAPFIILIPLFAIMYSSVQYGMMTTGQENEHAIILKSEVKNLLYKYMALGFGVGGFLAFISEWFFSKQSFANSAAYGLVFVLFGMLLNAIVNKKISEENKDNLVLLVISLVIPFIIFYDIGSGSTTVWVVPFLFIIAFMLYNNGRMLTGLSAASILTLIVAGTIVPEVSVVISKDDFSTRILLLSIGIIFAALINHIYMKRLLENTNQLSDQQMIAEVSTYMVSAVQENFDEKLNSVLMNIGKHYSMDRGYFFCFNKDGTTMSNTHEWCMEGVAAEIDGLQDIPVDIFPWWMNELKNNQVVTVPDVNRMPDEANVCREELKRQNVKSTMAVAVFVNKKQIGYMGIDAVKNKMAWRDDIITNMIIIGNVISDAFTKNNAEKVIHELAYFDQLTGLPSRQLYKDRLFQSMKMADRTRGKVAVALLDLDAFKVINDTMGHDKGDQLLIDVAGRLEKAVRTSDTVCRFGGDEFLLLCNNLKEDEDTIAIGEEVMAAFRDVFVLEQDEFNVTASMGIAVYPDDGNSTDKLIKNADIAMYHAKDLGKNTFALFNDQLKEKTMYTASLTNSLFRAVENNELFMFYQPQVELASNRITSVEALIRWQNKEHGLIAPSEFIHIAERNGYILELGEWILREVFRQMQAWRDEGYEDFVVAINISFIQIQNNRFVQLMADLIDEYMIAPDRIEFEITDSIAMNQRDNVYERLEKIRAMGIKIAIDDFGTEYSSLGRLKELTVDKIKIGRPFINGISKNSKDEAIIKSIIALAKNLEVLTIAEGVEREEQLDFLKQENCDYVQGFLYYKPMSANEVVTLLATQDH